MVRPHLQAEPIGVPAKRSVATFAEVLEARKRQRLEEVQTQEQLHAALLQQLAGDTSSDATNELLAELNLSQIQSQSSYDALPTALTPSASGNSTSSQGSRGPNKSVMCKFFQQGVCRNGSMCRFAHTVNEMLLDAPVAGRATKTIPCKFFEGGFCGRGELCNFSHGESKVGQAQMVQTEEQLIEELMQQQVIELAAAGEQSQVAQSRLAELMQIRELQKQAATLAVPGKSQSSSGKSKSGTPCVFWQRGACTKGDACSFAHTNAEDAGALVVGQQPFKVTICSFWQEGKCLKGADCTFAHGEEELGMSLQLQQQCISGSVVEPEPSSGFIEVGTAAYKEIADLMCYQPGTCRKGAACAYAHSGQDLADGLIRMGICKWSLQGACTAPPGRCKYEHIPDAQLTIVQHVVLGQLILTPCKYYAQGYCNEGTTCRFMHEGAPLAAPVRATPHGNCAPEGASEKKQMMCKFFQKGLCLKGDACIYAHSEDEIELPQNTDLSKYKTRMCQHFEMGYCAKGNLCTWAHDESEMQVFGVLSTLTVDAPEEKN